MLPLATCHSTGSSTVTSSLGHPPLMLVCETLADLDEGEFTEGHELDRKSVARQFLGQVDDLMLVDTEDHLLLTRQLHDEFQLLAGRMHQLDSHIALDLGNFSAEEIAAQEFEAQHVERSR